MTEVRYQSAFDSLGLIDGGNGSLRTDEIFGGGDEENGEILGKNYFAFLQEGAQGTEWGGRFMVALGNQGLNNLGELDCCL